MVFNVFLSPQTAEFLLSGVFLFQFFAWLTHSHPSILCRCCFLRQTFPDACTPFLPSQSPTGYCWSMVLSLSGIPGEQRPHPLHPHCLHSTKHNTQCSVGIRTSVD